MSYKSSVPLFWRLKKSKYTLTGTRCYTCGGVHFPPRTLCPNCRTKGKIEDFQFSGEGRIVSFTIIRVPPEEFEAYAPYAIALIELKEGVNIQGQVVGPFEQIEIGKRVTPVFRKMYEDGEAGLIHYGLKWKIAE